MPSTMMSVSRSRGVAAMPVKALRMWGTAPPMIGMPAPVGLEWVQVWVWGWVLVRGSALAPGLEWVSASAWGRALARELGLTWASAWVRWRRGLRGCRCLVRQLPGGCCPPSTCCLAEPVG